MTGQKKSPHIIRPPAEPEVLELIIIFFSTAYAFSVAVLRFLPYQTTIAP